MDKINLEVSTTHKRLDRYLSQEITNLSRSRIQQLIEHSKVQLNGKVCTLKKAMVKHGDCITLEIPPPSVMELRPQEIPLDILYEDEHLIILNKPAGLVVHPAPGHPDGTLVNALLAHCPHLPGIGGVQRLGNYTLMHFQLETGRTHQIRVHSTQIGHPIVGDQVYGSGRYVGVNLCGQALHAWKLSLEHPLSGEWIEVMAPAPREFTTLVEILQKRN